MAGDKKRRRYYRYWRKTYRRYRNVSMNYLRVKAEYEDKLLFPDQDVDGNIYWYEKRNLIDADARAVTTFSEAMSGWSSAAELQRIFAYYRLTGIRVEVIPDARNQSMNLSSVEYPVYFGWRMGNVAAMTLNEIRSVNQSMLLNPVESKARYWRVYGTDGGYIVSTNGYSAAFTVRSQHGGVYNSKPSWKVKISLYLLFRYARS